MAEWFVNSHYGDLYEACSAGNAPTLVHPCTVKVIAEEGIDISEHRAKSFDEFCDSSFDYILTHGVSGVDWSSDKHPLPENI